MARIAAIVRGPASHFATNGVLYPAGALVPADPGVPEEDVSDEPYRMKEVEYEARNGEIRTKKVRVRVPFRPADGEVTAEAPEEKSAGKGETLNVAKLLDKNADEIADKIAKGELDQYLAAVEAGEKSKGKPRKTVTDALKERREALGVS